MRVELYFYVLTLMDTLIVNVQFPNTDNESMSNSFFQDAEF
jgi:hypothetical protein